ncbi:hypothetical protein COO60DRAFT_1527499, partial [Scenedesmus sp. NREL 46B-D3]
GCMHSCHWLCGTAALLLLLLLLLLAAGRRGGAERVGLAALLLAAAAIGQPVSPLRSLLFPPLLHRLPPLLRCAGHLAGVSRLQISRQPRAAAQLQVQRTQHAHTCACSRQVYRQADGGALESFSWCKEAAAELRMRQA